MSWRTPSRLHEQAARLRPLILSFAGPLTHAAARDADAALLDSSGNTSSSSSRESGSGGYPAITEVISDRVQVASVPVARMPARATTNSTACLADWIQSATSGCTLDPPPPQHTHTSTSIEMWSTSELQYILFNMQELAEVVAANTPVFYLHPREKFFPCTVGWFLKHARLSIMKNFMLRRTVDKGEGSLQRPLTLCALQSCPNSWSVLAASASGGACDGRPAEDEL